jgi:type III pantothenate kinase
MLLAIDAGNTNCVFGFFEGKELRASLRLATGNLNTADEIVLAIDQFARLKQLPAASEIIFASVVPRLTPLLQRASSEQFAVQPLVVSPNLKLNITFDYPKPAEVGADRICNASAAYDLVKGPAVVVDFGTATNFDIVSGEGAYIGGVLAPGPEAAHAALAQRAAQLFQVSFKAPRGIIGKSTEEALQSGFYHGAVGQTDYILAKIIVSFNQRPRIIATGGLATSIAAGSRLIDEVLPNITLEGLRLIHSLNS